MARMHPFHRTELLVGGAAWERLQESRACVVGLGGVGSYAAEALVRAGVGRVTMVDFDDVCVTNLNRQLHATRDTVGQPKAEVMGARARAINPKADVRVVRAFYNPETSEEILGAGHDVVLDCIDNMTAKVHLLESCVTRGVRVICALGAGGRLDPTQVRTSDLSETKNDPFGRIVRDLLRQKGITSGIECVWSEEPPNDLDPFAQSAFRCICSNKDWNDVHSCESRFQVQGSISYMPAIFGLTMAGLATNRLIDRPIRGARPATLRQAPAEKPSRDRKRALLAEAGLAREAPDDDPARAT